MTVQWRWDRQYNEGGTGNATTANSIMTQNKGTGGICDDCLLNAGQVMPQMQWHKTKEQVAFVMNVHWSLKAGQAIPWLQCQWHKTKKHVVFMMTICWRWDRWCHDCNGTIQRNWWHLWWSTWKTVWIYIKVITQYNCSNNLLNVETKLSARVQNHTQGTNKTGRIIVMSVMLVCFGVCVCVCVWLCACVCVPYKTRKKHGAVMTGGCFPLSAHSLVT